ncbi:polysaccharide pyruvyl transferase family protein [Microbacterium pumilum]|uniref:Polysaccharide pyruvyl transferase domain-containing protein n=1 Tax=Microbacterium pumilum TaxID=344165 RepID=A0ABN2S9C9_9MICO
MDRVLIRFYDRANLGDDLLVYLLASRFANTFTVLLREPCKALEDLDNVVVRRADSARRSVLSRLKRRLTGRGPRLHADLERASRSNDVLVYIGGSIFIEHPGKLDTWKRERDHYRALGIPYFIIDANFGPYLSDEYPEIVRDILSGADDVCFRDSYSRDVFADVPAVRSAIDVGFLTPVPTRSPAEHADVVISMIDTRERFDAAAADAYEAAMAGIAERTVRSGSRVCLMSFCSYQGDDQAAERIRARLSPDVAAHVFRHDYVGDLEEALAIIACSQTVIGARFHAVVLGLAFGKAVLPIAYSKKTVDTLTDIGYGGTIVDLNDSALGWDRVEDLAWTMPSSERERLSRAAAVQFQVLDERLVRSQSDRAKAHVAGAERHDS